MKKIIATFLAILYMSNAIGITVHLHFCMGELADLSFSYKVEDRCSKCGMKNSERNKGCCKDEYKTFKITDHRQSQATSHDLSVIHFAPIYIPEYSNKLQPVYADNFYQVDRYLPPLFFRPCPIYIKVCDFRI